MKPDYLRDMLVPPERIAEMAKFAKGEEGYDTPEELVIKTAWHETGHAVGYALKGGVLERTTIIPNGDYGGVLWGETVYGIDDQKVVWTEEERQLQAFAAMCGAAICQLAGIEECETMFDFESAIEWLEPLYPAPEELCGQLIKTWIEVLEFFGTPRVWRTAEAFARKLVLQGTIEGFPRECISDDNSPIPGLQDSLAKALGTGDPWEQHDWLCFYVMPDYDQIRRHHRAIAPEPGQDPRQLGSLPPTRAPRPRLTRPRGAPSSAHFLCSTAPQASPAPTADRRGRRAQTPSRPAGTHSLPLAGLKAEPLRRRARRHA